MDVGYIYCDTLSDYWIHSICRQLIGDCQFIKSESRERERGAPTRVHVHKGVNDVKWIGATGDERNPTSSSNSLYSPFRLVNDSFHLLDMAMPRHWRGGSVQIWREKEVHLFKTWGWTHWKFWITLKDKVLLNFLDLKPKWNHERRNEKPLEVVSSIT